MIVMLLVAPARFLGGPSPPHSPDLEAAPQGLRDSKENKEPSPKMRRRRSVKISSIALEPAQWQNDALHILTSAHDYRSMNDFLMKKVREQTCIRVSTVQNQNQNSIKIVLYPHYSVYFTSFYSISLL